jgi:hypothetical protein
MTRQYATLEPLIAKFSDPASPATILIQKNDKGVWEDDLSLSTSGEMERRRDARESKYLAEWKDRKRVSQGHAPHDLPHYKRIKDHVPAILIQGEWARFECAQPFLMIVTPETELEQTEGAPASPFVGTDSNFPFAENSRKDPNRDVHFVLRQVSADADKQLFFKLLYIVLDKVLGKPNKKPELGDPDFFCDR